MRYEEEYLGAYFVYRSTSLRMKLFRISICAPAEIFIDLTLLRNDPVSDFKTVLLSFLVTFAANSDAIF